MSEYILRSPVALLIFNRPDTTERVFEAIARARPSKLLVVADGPRNNRPGEDALCEQTRAVIARVDWPCEVITNFAERNMGCKLRVSSGIDWIFEQVEEAIILEDDCLPDPSFFRFCDEMLERYRHSERVGMVSGGNLQFGKTRGAGSYYFSKYTHIWGWASWRRAWRHYERDLTLWPAFRDQGLLEQIFEISGEQAYWRDAFQGVHEGTLDTWDASWTFTSLTHGLLQIVPNVNLISNIGFGANATHTQVEGRLSNLATQAISFPLTHPSFVVPNTAADRFIATDQIAPSFYRRKWRRVKRLFGQSGKS